MGDEKVVFHNTDSGETLVHKERDDGTRDLFYGPTGSSDHGHAVISPSGVPYYLRDIGGNVIADNRYKEK